MDGYRWTGVSIQIFISGAKSCDFRAVLHFVGESIQTTDSFTDIDYFDLHLKDFSDIEIWYGLEEREGCQQTLREIMEEGVELSDWQ